MDWYKSMSNKHSIFLWVLLVAIYIYRITPDKEVDFPAANLYLCLELDSLLLEQF